MSKGMMYSARIMKRLGRRGFTIIELMIATLIFSIVLILITYGVISFNNAYYHGIVQSDTQNVARTVVGNISQALQFSGTPVYTTLQGTDRKSEGYCVGDQRYSYVLGDQLVTGTVGADQTNHALMRDTVPAGCDGGTHAQPLTTGPIAGGSNELLGEKMRLAKLSINPLGNNLYSIDVRVVYGDDDLLCAPTSSPGSCSSTRTMPSGSYGVSDLECKPNIPGSQFCAVSELATTVQKRIN